jgi:hypothetical protein
MVTKTKKDFSIAFLLRDNNNNNNNGYSSKLDSNSVINSKAITPPEYLLTSKYNILNMFFNKNKI